MKLTGQKFSFLFFFFFGSTGGQRSKGSPKMLRPTAHPDKLQVTTANRFTKQTDLHYNVTHWGPLMINGHCPLSACTYFFTDARNIFTFLCTHTHARTYCCTCSILHTSYFIYFNRIAEKQINTYRACVPDISWCVHAFCACVCSFK